MARLTPDQIKPIDPEAMDKFLKGIDQRNKDAADRNQSNQIDPSRILLNSTQKRLLERLDEEREPSETDEEEGKEGEEGEWIGVGDSGDDNGDILIEDTEYLDPIQIWQPISSVPTNRKVWLMHKGLRYCGQFLFNRKGKAYFKYDGYSKERHATYWCDIPWTLRRQPDPIVEDGE